MPHRTAAAVSLFSSLFPFLLPLSFPCYECFHAIAADQNFYINDNNQLVIVFDEYTVAPGSMGMPEFVLPNDILTDLLRQPSLLADVEEERGTT